MLQPDGGEVTAHQIRSDFIFVLLARLRTSVSELLSKKKGGPTKVGAPKYFPFIESSLLVKII